MNYNDYLKGFSVFSGAEEINEMASSLTRMGVPKELMQFIHKLSGETTKIRDAQKQLNPQTGEFDVQFHTRKEPTAAKKGPWPGRTDTPLAHDVEIVGQKTGRRNIQHYLEITVPKDMDTNLRLILDNPSSDQIHYLTTKLGKMSKDERIKRFNSDDINVARAAGSSTKSGQYMRTVTIDRETATPIAAWEGTIGQMLNDVDEESTLYILEKEERVGDKRKERKERTEVTVDDFLEDFVKSFEKIADKVYKSRSKAKTKEFKTAMGSVTPEDFEAFVQGRGAQGELAAKLKSLTAEINNTGFDVDSLKPQLHNFQELAFKEGEYKSEDDKNGKKKASLTDMVHLHDMPTVQSMFLHYVLMNKKVNKKFFSGNVFKQFGLDDLM